jgi:hypothetical protein
MTRDQLVKSLVTEYRKNGERAAIKLFDASIKRFEISQFGIRQIILDFRQEIAVKDSTVTPTASQP